MHGVRRSRPTAAELQEELDRSAVHADLIRRALIVRHAELPPTFDDEFWNNYKVVERALEANPDEYTLWSFRREVLVAAVNADREANFDDRWQHELELTTRALKWHQKAYPAWQHRLWLLRDQQVARHLSPELRKRAIQNEEKLSEFMLSRDCRNFHGWAHRMRVRAVVSSTTGTEESILNQSELAFVERMINEDFANYSAWHHRSVLLPKVSVQGPDSFLQDELAFVRQAFYTEPDVQSAWFYHRWLLSGAPSKGRKAAVVNQVLEDELKACNELLELEPEARYALQTKAQLLVQLAQHDAAKELLQSLEILVSFSMKSLWIVIKPFSNC